MFPWLIASAAFVFGQLNPVPTKAPLPLKNPLVTQDAIKVDLQKQLFIDDFLLDHQEKITRTWHQFKRKASQPLMVAEMPWERANLDYGTVIRDPESGLFRLWYLTYGTRPLHKGDRGLDLLICYATSSDGLQWTRPNLGIFEIDGSKQNNVVARSLGPIRAVSVIHNPNAPDPARRYIHLKMGLKGAGTSPSYSADGLHWSEDEPAIFQASDAASLSYDPRQDRYFCFSVSDVKARGFVRRSIEMTGTDLKTWSKMKTVLVADEIDDAGAPARIARLRSILDYDDPDQYHAQLHHMIAVPYESIALGFVTLWDNVWYTVSALKPLYAGGRDRAIIHTQLTWSRDRDWQIWQRPASRSPLLELSEPGAWDCAAQLPFPQPVRVGDELWLYYVGFSRVFNSPRVYGPGLPEGERATANGLGVAAMRLDGFASLDASPRGGVFVTKPLIFKGSRLILNARALGHISIELLDSDGKPIPGFDRATIAGDSLRHDLLSAKGVKNSSWARLGELAGQPVRLRFDMWNSLLYSIVFQE